MKNQKIIDTVISDIKKLAFNLRKLPEFLALHAFLFILTIFIVNLFIGGVVLYKYIYLAKSETAVKGANQLMLDEKKYQSVLLEWQKRDKSFNEITTPVAKNLFE